GFVDVLELSPVDEERRSPHAMVDASCEIDVRVDPGAVSLTVERPTDLCAIEAKLSGQPLESCSPEERRAREEEVVRPPEGVGPPWRRARGGGLSRTTGVKINPNGIVFPEEPYLVRVFLEESLERRGRGLRERAREIREFDDRHQRIGRAARRRGTQG